jgi:hypothetical protein
LHKLIWSLLNVEPAEGRVVTARLDVNFLLNILRGLGPIHLDAQQEADFNDLLNVITDLYADRNMIAHGKWGTLLPEKLPAAASLRDKGDGTVPPSNVIVETYPDFRMIQILQNIVIANNSLIKVMDAHDTSHGRQIPRHRRP